MAGGAVLAMAMWSRSDLDVALMPSPAMKCPVLLCPAAAAFRLTLPTQGSAQQVKRQHTVLSVSPGSSHRLPLSFFPFPEPAAFPAADAARGVSQLRLLAGQRRRGHAGAGQAEGAVKPGKQVSLP